MNNKQEDLKSKILMAVIYIDGDVSDGELKYGFDIIEKSEFNLVSEIQDLSYEIDINKQNGEVIKNKKILTNLLKQVKGKDLKIEIIKEIKKIIFSDFEVEDEEIVVFDLIEKIWGYTIPPEEIMRVSNNSKKK